MSDARTPTRRLCTPFHWAMPDRSRWRCRLNSPTWVENEERQPNSVATGTAETPRGIYGSHVHANRKRGDAKERFSAAWAKCSLRRWISLAAKKKG
mmetsp:Transcript_15790/g.40577  ORF Transcript_15790/g.40577 Transcript_15790/m.40577 type:complete len:96 (-) Transcript_15790:10-297(-)